MAIHFDNLIKEAFSVASENMRKLADSVETKAAVAQAGKMIVETYKNGGCLFACGNGGSAADSQHFVAEFVSKLQQDRTPIRAFSMTVDTSILTAIGNDYGYEYVFSRQVEGLMSSRDVLFAITTSGNSPNILKALEECRNKGARSILLTGRDGGKAKAMADLSIVAPGTFTGSIQEAHLVIYHTLCFMVEKALVESGVCQYR